MRRPFKAIVDPWRAILLTGCAVIFAVLAAERGPDGIAHQSMLTALRALDLHHASLQRDVLQARAGLLRNYDPIVDSVVGLHETLDRLQALAVDAGIRDAEFQSHIDGLVSALERDEGHVEEFKTRNALLQNSLGIFGQALRALHDSPLRETRRAIIDTSDLGNLMMQFSTEPHPSIALRLQNQFGILASLQNAPPDIRSLVTHGSMVLATLPALDEGVRAIQRSDFSSRTRGLQQDYLDHFAELTERASWSRIVLGAISLALCASVSLLVLRLRQHAGRLSGRLEFEAVLGRAKDTLAAAGVDEHPASVSAAVNLIAGFFRANDWTLALIELKSGDERERYSTSAEPFASIDSLILKLVTHFSSEDTDDPRNRFFFEETRRRAATDRLRNEIACALTSAEGGNETALLLVLRQSDEAPAFDEEMCALMRNAVEILAQSLAMQRGRRERHMLETRLEHAQRLEAIGTLAGGIAHEFNNILGAIMGYGEMAMQSLTNPSPIRYYVGEIVSAGERAKHVVDQVLTFSRKRDRVARPFDAVEAVADILPLLRASLKDFELTGVLPEQPLAVMGNPISLQQIAMNLCRNACEASGISGSVRIGLRRNGISHRRELSHGRVEPGNYIVLSVSDTGSGIPETLLPHIFEPFFTTKAGRGGTGLGLAAVYGCAAELEGRIHVESRPGRGTLFEIYIPSCDDEPVPLAEFFHENTVSSGSGQTVLVLEKDRSLLLALEEKLAALGYEPIGFGALDGVLRWLESGQTPDLMALDVSSLDRAATPSAMESLFGKVPYLLIVDEDGRGSGADMRLKLLGALTKPLHSKALADAIRKQLQTPLTTSAGKSISGAYTPNGTGQ